MVLPKDEILPPKADFSAPPPYEPSGYNADIEQQLEQQPQQQQSSKLPTYEEVQYEKTLDGTSKQHQQQQQQHHHNNLPPQFDIGEHTPQQFISQTPALTFIAIDTTNSNNANSIIVDNEDDLLGTDTMFLTSFLIAFLFNWIGFLMLTCFCHTIAGRYGALSGFGLSLAKWTLIVKHSTDLASHENTWLWWLIMAFGFLICMRALVQYISIKRTWRLLSASAQERLLFFY